MTSRGPNGAGEAWRDGCSPEYLAACEAHDRAAAVFNEFRTKFRDGKLSLDAFICARHNYEQACAAYDKAFFRAGSRGK